MYLRAFINSTQTVEAQTLDFLYWTEFN
jgi:hypothetical protein